MSNNFFNRVADLFDGFKDSQPATPQQPVLPTRDTRPIPPSSALQKSADALPSVKNWSHPFKAKGNPLAQLVKLSKAAAGYYPLGRNGLWHGGVHFDAGTAGVMDQSSVSCLADGEVVAYRIDGLSPKTVYLINKVSVMKPFSRNFVLVRHRLQPPHIEGSADIPPSLTFYSLYMHLQDWAVYRRDHAIDRPKFWPEGHTRRVKATVKDVLPGHPGQQGLNVRNQVQRGKVLALLPRGAEVTVSGEGDYRKLEKTNGPDALKSADGSLRGYLSIYFLEAIAGDEYRVRGNASLNVRAEASASSKVIAELPMGTEVTVSGEGEFRKLERVNQYVHFKSLEGAREPLADSIVVLKQPIAIKAGDLIGHIGQYQDSKAEHPEEKLHLEVFSGDDVDTFIEASRAWAQRLPATGKTWLKLAKGTPVVTHQARFNATQPPTLNAAHTPSDADLWVPKSLLDGLPAEKKIVIPATADRKAYNWYRLDGLLHDANSQLLDGWVREEVGVTPWVNPWSWEGYETIYNYDTPRQSLASFLRAVGRFNETELGRHGALAEMSDKGPMKSRLYDIIDRNHDGKMTAEELQAAMCLPAHAQSLSHLIIHYESEWHYKPQKWDALDEVLGHSGSTPHLNWLAEKERIKQISWWNEVAPKVGLPAHGKVYHFHPVGLVGRFSAESDDNDLKWLKVPYGQLTFDVEGNDIEDSSKSGHRYFSRVVHWPGGASGVTIGRGYDLGQRPTPDTDLSAACIEEPLRSWLIGAKGLSGQAARDYLNAAPENIRKKTITRKQQYLIFKSVYKAMEAEVLRISNQNYNIATYGQVDWSRLSQKIRDIAVDLCFRGDYIPATRQKVQKPIADNDMHSLKNMLSIRENWHGVPQDRFEKRKNYLGS